MPFHRMAQLVVSQSQRGGSCALVETVPRKRFFQKGLFVSGHRAAKIVQSLLVFTGSHRIAITSDAGPFTDPDGFGWEAGA